MPEENVSLIISVFESVTDPLVIYDRDFRILRVNPALAGLYRQSVEQLAGRYCYELFYGRSSVCGDCHVARVFRTGEPQRCNKSITLPDCGTRFFEVNAYPIRDDHGAIRQVVEHSRDITEGKRLENKLKASEERYRTIVQGAREGIFLLDDQGLITFVNQCFADMVGHPAAAIIGRSMYEFLDGKSAEIAKAQHQLRQNGSPGGYEAGFVRGNGERFTGLMSVSSVAVNGATLGEVGIVTDINPLKLKEKELRAAKNFTESIINSITDNFAVIDAGTYHILQMNVSFLRRTGHESSASVLQKPCFEVLLKRDRPCSDDGIPCPVREAIACGSAVNMEKIYPDDKGEERIMQIAAYPLLSPEGAGDLVILLEQDVTDKSRMQKALALRSRELQKAQHQLESIFRISRQVNMQGSIKELVLFLYETAKGVFADADPIFVLLDARGERMLPPAQFGSAASEPFRQVLERLEHAGNLAEAIRHMDTVKDSRIITSRDGTPHTPFFTLIAELYPCWFGIPILCQQQCIGYFIVGAQQNTMFAPEDVRFFQSLFDQVAGHMRHLILHEDELERLRFQASERTSYGEIIGQSKRMQEIYELIDLVSCSDATVLITGDNGTGKELVARAIHAQSHRSKGPFVVANCSAYSPTLLESELFGHEKGAFTGAIRQVKGRIERAHGGTLFLDEIGDIAPATQILLLRFLQDRCFERVGGEKTIEADVRILAATNRDLVSEVKAGRFRDDLYYRLNVISIHLPSLCERKEDIPLLAQHFLRKFSLKESKKIRKFSPDCIQTLMDHDWPGNVRQLENAISHATVLCQGETIRRNHLPRFLKGAPLETVSTSLAENERRLIMRVLEEARWNKHEAARRLQMSRSTLYSKISRYGLKKASVSV